MGTRRSVWRFNCPEEVARATLRTPWLGTIALADSIMTTAAPHREHLMHLPSGRLMFQIIGAMAEFERAPGRGRGNFSCFRFRELDFSTQQGVEKGLEKAVQKAVQKAVVFEPLIRKEDQNQNQDQSQRLLVAPSSDRSLRSESGHQA